MDNQIKMEFESIHKHLNTNSKSIFAISVSPEVKENFIELI